ncbi:Nitrogen regulation protein NtrC [Minicystis rosea]|nr:Nitrogen regulation protein NtrC [Minicystis rosea]
MDVRRTTNKMDVAPAARTCRMRVIHGAEAGTEAQVPGVGVVIGADAGADVVLTDPSVSRRHCSVRPTPQGFEVKDLGSRNGTFLDNISVTRAIVPVGAVIRVGSTLLQLVPAEEPVVIAPSERSSFGAMCGGSLAMRQVYALLERASLSSAPVLLLGESGTGKELAARAVHENSPRREGPFVVFDCGAASESLIESDLFGHVKGAFTGAEGNRAGAFERAHGGTLFLDEIGDLPLALQPKLLRLLEAGEAMPLGGRKHEKFDVRVVAATHRDLAVEVSRGAFRGDLYYRLAVVEVHLPPLRQRIEDVESLAQGFLAREGAPEGALRSPNLDRLLAYGWPGNVRELRNVIARAVALAAPGARFARMPILLAGASTTLRSEAPVATADVPYHEAKAEVLNRFERDYLRDLLARSGHNVAQAARHAGVGRKLLYSMLSRTGLAAGLRAPDDDA